MTRDGGILTPDLQEYLENDKLKRQKKAKYMVERRLKLKAEKNNQAPIPNEDTLTNRPQSYIPVLSSLTAGSSRNDFGSVPINLDNNAVSTYHPLTFDKGVSTDPPPQPPTFPYPTGEEQRPLTLDKSIMTDPISTVVAIPVHDSTEHIVNLTSFDEFQYPEEFPTVVWSGGGYKTGLPYIRDPQNPLVNLLKNDETHVRHLSQTALVESDWVVYVKYEEHLHDVDLAKEIAENLQYGRTVVLKGHPYESAALNETSLYCRFNLFGRDPVVVSDAACRLDNPTYPFVHMTLSQFCDGAKDNSRIQCILDVPTLDGERPRFLKFLDDGYTSYGRMDKRFPARQHINVDVQKSASWSLLHQGLYHTYAHHDANGHATWTQVLSGYKFWVIVRPKNHQTDRNRHEIFNTTDKLMIAEPNEHGFYHTETDRVVIYAGPGDFIIMPPATLHEVFTPVPSVTIGGHFYTYNTLHLTELARSIDKGSMDKFTNQTTGIAGMTIMAMTSILPIMVDRGINFSSFLITSLFTWTFQVIHRKPLASLCHMVLYPQKYGSEIIDADLLVYNSKHTQPRKRLSDVDNAISIAQKLVKSLNLPQNVEHYPRGNKNREDFIFDGYSFLDPGPPVPWAGFVTDLQFEPIMSIVSEPDELQVDFDNSEDSDYVD